MLKDRLNDIFKSSQVRCVVDKDATREPACTYAHPRQLGKRLFQPLRQQEVTFESRHGQAHATAYRRAMPLRTCTVRRRLS
jgi:hypothetical protein